MHDRHVSGKACGRSSVARGGRVFSLAFGGGTALAERQGGLRF
jgi:hypothetical protein